MKPTRFRPALRDILRALICTLCLILVAQSPAQETPLLPPVRVIGQRPEPTPPPPEPAPTPAPESAPVPPAFSIQESRSAPVSNAIGSSPSASEGSINQLDIANQPYNRAANVLEFIPGLVTQDAYGTVNGTIYLLRGFFIDHGTDFSVWIDDVPYNQVNHVHLHGFLDVNSLIPELVQTIDFKKGVYYPEAGDFSNAGTARITLVDSLPAGMVRGEFGKNSWYRELIANSGCLGDGVLLYAADATYFNGPWEFPENSRLFKGILRYTMGDTADGLRLTALGYSGVGHLTDFIPLAAVESGLLERFGTVDPFQGVSTQRFQGNAQWWHRDDAGDLAKANLYYVYYGYDEFFNETGNFEDPVNGDLLHRFEHRSTFGGNLEQSWNSRLFGDCVRNTVGLQVRNDNIPHIGDEHDVARNLLNVIDEARITESNIGIYFKNDVKWGEKLRTVLGVRADYFHWHVDDFVLPENSGKTESKLIEPKGSLILGPWCNTEFYLNGGYGFHSNDARGILGVDSAPLLPLSQGGEITPTTPVSPIARSRGAEVGMKTQAIPYLTSTVAVWYLHLASELFFEPDALISSPRGPSERWGVEVSNTYRLNGWLTFDADWAASQARFTTVDFLDAVSPQGGTRVPQAIGVLLSGGPTIRLPSGYFAALRYKYIGPRDLTSDGLISSHATNQFDLGLGYESLRFTAGVNILNLFNSNGVDNAAEGDTAVNGVAFAGTQLIHPQLPFQARFYFNLRW
jgi:hypothetical protein